MHWCMRYVEMEQSEVFVPSEMGVPTPALSTNIELSPLAQLRDVCLHVSTVWRAFSGHHRIASLTTSFTTHRSPRSANRRAIALLTAQHSPVTTPLTAYSLKQGAATGKELQGVAADKEPPAKSRRRRRPWARSCRRRRRGGGRTRRRGRRKTSRRRKRARRQERPWPGTTSASPSPASSPSSPSGPGSTSPPPGHRARAGRGH